MAQDVRFEDDERVLIYCNLLNGNEVDQVARAFQKSTSEIDEIFRFITKKIKSYCFERAYPYIAMDTLQDARKNRGILLNFVEKNTQGKCRINLGTDPKYSKIVTYNNLSPTQIQDAILQSRLKQ